MTGSHVKYNETKTPVLPNIILTQSYFFFLRFFKKDFFAAFLGDFLFIIILTFNKKTKHNILLATILLASRRVFEQTWRETKSGKFDANQQNMADSSEIRDFYFQKRSNGIDKKRIKLLSKPLF